MPRPLFADLDDLPVAVVAFDAGQAVRVNGDWLRLSGLDAQASLGEGWLAAIHPDDRDEASCTARFEVAEPAVAREWRLVPIDDEGDTWVHVRVRWSGREPRRVCIVTMTEVGSRKANELRLLHMATHDGLTGLMNRDAFFRKVEETMAIAPQQPAGLLFVDLDGFKAVNDRFGHRAGDVLLTAVAQRISRAVRPTDIVARLGGDEFGIIAPHVDSIVDTSHIAERVARAMDDPFAVTQRMVTVRASVGLAQFDDGWTSAATLVEAADRAMYAAKSAGGGHWARAAHADHPTSTDWTEHDTDAAAVSVRGLQRALDHLRHITAEVADASLAAVMGEAVASIELARTKLEALEEAHK